MVSAAGRRLGVTRLTELVVTPEAIPAGLAFTFALIPPFALALWFYRHLALALLATAVCVATVWTVVEYALRRGRNLPGWLGRGAQPALVCGLLVVAFAAPRMPLPVVGVIVAATIAIERVLAPVLPRSFLSAPLVGAAALVLAQHRLGVPYTNPFDLRPLAEPFALVAESHRAIDPIKLYVGNVPGPLAATSAAAILVGWSYLWYARRVAGGMLASFAVATVAAAVALRQDPILPLVSGPVLFVTALLAADRRHLPAPRAFVIGLGFLAGLLTVGLRSRGQRLDAVWEAWLAVGIAATVAGWAWRRPAPLLRRPRPPVPIRVGPEESRAPEAFAATLPRGRDILIAAPGRRAIRAPREPVRRAAWTVERVALLALLLLVFNPAGLLIIWRARLTLRFRIALTVASLLWYAAGVLALLFLLKRI